MGTAADVGAMVVTLGHTPRLRTCLEALRAAAPDCEVVCVVNDADRGAGGVEVPGVRYLYPGINLGWTAGLHHARARIERPFLWLIQDDITVGPGVLEVLIERLDADAGLPAARPAAVDEDGVVQVGRCGAMLDADGGLCAFVPPAPVPLADLEIPADLDVVPGSAMLVRAEVWDRLGGFNPWLRPLGLGDVDFAVAMARAGLRAEQITSAHVGHLGHASTPTLLGEFAITRADAIFRACWFPHALPPAEERRQVICDAHIAAAVEYRRTVPRLTDEDLVAIAGAAGADAMVRMARRAERGVRDLRAAYAATVEARDWWRDQHAAADRAWRRASGQDEAPGG